MSNGALLLALPSKGRLKEETEALFARAGLPSRRGRGAAIAAGIAGMTTSRWRSSPLHEIARELGDGNVASRRHRRGPGARDGGRRRRSGDRFCPARLRPGRCRGRRAGAVDRRRGRWQDLDDVAAGFRARHGRRLRIATKYWNLRRASSPAHGIALYRIVESLGATEGAPAAGTADVIVDITTTGATLAANHLKVLEDGVILRSEANLAASLRRPGATKRSEPLVSSSRRSAARASACTPPRPPFSRPGSRRFGAVRCWKTMKWTGSA